MNMCMSQCRTVLHNTAMNSSDNLPSYPLIIAPMSSTGGEGETKLRTTDSKGLYKSERTQRSYGETWHRWTAQSTWSKDRPSRRPHCNKTSSNNTRCANPPQTILRFMFMSVKYLHSQSWLNTSVKHLKTDTKNTTQLTTVMRINHLRSTQFLAQITLSHTA